MSNFWEHRFDRILLTDIKSIFFMFIISRVIFFLILYYCIYILNIQYDYGSIYLTYDGYNYYDIALNGYSKEYLYAFFPLFPVVIRIFSYVNIAISGTLFLNHVLTLVIAYLLYFTSRDIMQKSRNNCLLIAKLWLFSPITITTCILYSEPLFVFFTLSTYYLYKKEHYFQAGVLLGLSVLTRNIGSMLFFAIFVVMLLEYLFSKNKIKTTDILTMYIPATLISCLYPFYLYIKLSNWHYFVDVQFKYWSRVNSNIISVIYYDLRMAFINPLVFIFTYTSLLICIYIIIKTIRGKKYYDLILYMVFSIIAVFSTCRTPEIDFPSTSYYRYLFGIISMYLLIDETMVTKAIHLVYFSMGVFTMMVYCLGRFFI